MDYFCAEVLIDRKFMLAEGPVWDDRLSRLHFVDIKGCTLYTFDPRTEDLKETDVSQNIGCFALREKGGFIMGLASGVYLMDPDGEMRRFSSPEFDAMTRSNDGKCDLQGNFWCGTSDLKDGACRGKLYRLSPDGSCAEMQAGLSISNGLAFREDRMYFIDSIRRRVEAYRLDQERGEMTDCRTVADMTGKPYVPDGMSIDEEGKLWVAHWGGGFVGRYDPESGELLARVEVPASQTSSCCFGGTDLQTLFITTASVGKEEEPGAGRIYAVRLPWKGTVMNRFLG